MKLLNNIIKRFFSLIFKNNLNTKAFTLLELSIVLGIMSILLSFVAPIWMNQRINQGVEKTVAEMEIIMAAAKSFYMESYYSYEPRESRWPNDFGELKAMGMLSDDFPEVNPFGNDYEFINDLNRFSIETELPKEENVNYAASLLPGGRGEDTNLIAEIHIPGSAPSLDNLLHRDELSTDEQRTMHNDIIMDTSLNTAMVDQDEPDRYLIDLNDDSKLAWLRVYNSLYIGETDYQTETRMNEEINALLSETDAERFQFGSSDKPESTVLSYMGEFASGRNRMDFFLTNVDGSLMDVGYFEQNEHNQEDYDFHVPLGTVNIKDEMYPDAQNTDQYFGAFHNFYDTSEYPQVDIRQGLVMQALLVQHNTVLPKPDCPYGTSPNILLSASSFSEEGTQGLPYPTADIYTLARDEGDYWRILMRRTRVISRIEPSDNGTQTIRNYEIELTSSSDREFARTQLGVPIPEPENANGLYFAQALVFCSAGEETETQEQVEAQAQ
jgi:prepilin-type N-terminal cleavage/methylation domain-containing protein